MIKMVGRLRPKMKAQPPLNFEGRKNQAEQSIFFLRKETILQQTNLLLITQQDGIKRNDQLVHRIDSLQLFYARKLADVKQFRHGHIVQELRFPAAEAVDLNFGQFVPLGLPRIVPEHRIAGVEDRGHGNKPL